MCLEMEYMTDQIKVPLCHVYIFAIEKSLEYIIDLLGAFKKGSCIQAVNRRTITKLFIPNMWKRETKNMLLHPVTGFLSHFAEVQSCLDE